jgi:hypothetical protein
MSKGMSFLMGFLATVAVGAVVLLAVNSFGDKKTTSNQSTPNIVINVPGAYAENGAGTSNKEEEVKVPIREEYSCRGNYWSVFTQKSNVTDNCGTTYDSANVAVVGINAITKKLTYNLDGSYTTLSGTIALAEEDKDRINYFRVLVYNEDNECFYESDWISDKQPNPIDVNCNISGMTRITIELEGCSTTCSTVKVIMPDEGFVFKGPKGTVDAND